MGFRKKVKAFIKDDRPAKLRSYISSQNADPRHIFFSRGRNVLHYCAEFGSSDMMRCLLRLECEPMHQDKDGRLPLHTALYRCLEEDANKAKETYESLVCLLLDVSPMSQDVEDKDGVTGLDLLRQVKQKLRTGHGYQKEGTRGRPSVEEEFEWQAKMAREFQYEFEDQQPHYSFVEDYSHKEEEEEDFGTWSDRMYQEYRKKKQLNSRKRRSHPANKAGDGSEQKKSKPELDPDEELRKAREEMRKNYKSPVENVRKDLLLARKTRYEKQFINFCNHPPDYCSVTFATVPWPCTNMDKLTDTLFCDLPDKESPAYRKYLKQQQVRWHPDKFSQKFSAYLHRHHHKKIMTRVNAISQTLNALAN